MIANEDVDRDDDRERVRRSRIRSSTSIANTVEYVDQDNACKRASRQRRELLDNFLSIAMRIASKCCDREHDRVLPIATAIAKEQVSCDESRMTTFVDREGDCERVRRLQTRSSVSITTMLANELVDGDEGRLTTFCRSR